MDDQRDAPQYLRRANLPARRGTWRAPTGTLPLRRTVVSAEPDPSTSLRHSVGLMLMTSAAAYGISAEVVDGNTAMALLGVPLLLFATTSSVFVLPAERTPFDYLSDAPARRLRLATGLLLSFSLFATGYLGWEVLSSETTDVRSVAVLGDRRTVSLSFLGTEPYVEDDPCTEDYEARAEVVDGRLEVSVVVTAAQFSHGMAGKGGTVGCDNIGYLRSVEVTLDEPFTGRRRLRRRTSASAAFLGGGGYRSRHRGGIGVHHADDDSCPEDDRQAGRLI